MRQWYSEPYRHVHLATSFLCQVVLAQRSDFVSSTEVRQHCFVGFYALYGTKSAMNFMHIIVRIPLRAFCYEMMEQDELCVDCPSVLSYKPSLWYDLVICQSGVLALPVLFSISCLLHVVFTVCVVTVLVIFSSIVSLVKHLLVASNFNSSLVHREIVKW